MSFYYCSHPGLNYKHSSSVMEAVSSETLKIMSVLSMCTHANGAACWVLFFIIIWHRFGILGNKGKVIHITYWKNKPTGKQSIILSVTEHIKFLFSTLFQPWQEINMNIFIYIANRAGTAYWQQPGWVRALCRGGDVWCILDPSAFSSFVCMQSALRLAGLAEACRDSGAKTY